MQGRITISERWCWTTSRGGPHQEQREKDRPRRPQYCRQPNEGRQSGYRYQGQYRPQPNHRKYKFCEGKIRHHCSQPAAINARTSTNPLNIPPGFCSPKSPQEHAPCFCSPANEADRQCLQQHKNNRHQKSSKLALQRQIEYSPCLPFSAPSGLIL